MKATFALPVFMGAMLAPINIHAQSLSAKLFDKHDPWPSLATIFMIVVVVAVATNWKKKPARAAATPDESPRPRVVLTEPCDNVSHLENPTLEQLRARVTEKASDVLYTCELVSNPDIPGHEASGRLSCVARFNPKNLEGYPSVIILRSNGTTVCCRWETRMSAANKVLLADQQVSKNVVV